MTNNMKKTDKLAVWWSKREKDYLINSPAGFGTNSDAHWLSGFFNKEFENELKQRGYDPTTLKFSIEPAAGEMKFRVNRPEMNDDEAWQACIAQQQEKLPESPMNTALKNAVTRLKLMSQKEKLELLWEAGLVSTEDYERIKNGNPT